MSLDHRDIHGDLGVDDGLFVGIGLIVQHDEIAVIPAGRQLRRRVRQKIQLFRLLAGGQGAGLGDHHILHHDLQHDILIGF